MRRCRTWRAATPHDAADAATPHHDAVAARLSVRPAAQVTRGEEYPRVVVQLPMFNEREVCQDAIDACCELTWPRDRLLVQILDDSTDEVTRERIEDKARRRAPPPRAR